MQDTLLLAEATVDGDIDLRPGQMPEVQVRAGRPFTVRYTYKVYESSRDEDQWRFRLVANLEGEDNAVSEVVHKDRRVFRDDVWSHLRQDHICPEPGEYVLDFTAEAEMSRRAWGDELPPQARHSKQVSGKVRIRAL